jgi:alpha-L-glutamate ligase-like protein
MSVLQTLRREGVLGINCRNIEYTLRCNRRRFYPRVDDKLATKRLCQAANIPIPQLLAAADHHFELRQLPAHLADEPAFVLKPAHGAMGNGVLVIVDRDGDQLRLADDRVIGMQDFLYHGASIISGLYSLAGQPDVAMVEQRLEVHPAFEEIVSGGVPDVRVIVFRGIPVMAMTRLPTRRAAGRANLHQGAVGAGVDLETGRTVHAVLKDHPVRVHPDTGQPLLGRALPDFERVVEIAVHATDQTELDYVGADIVVDARRGPVILELNARPGLAVQTANRAGLLPRLRAVERMWRPDLALEKRLELGRAIAREASRTSC